MSQREIETSATYVNDVMYLSTNEKKLINRIMRYGKERPGSLNVIRGPSENDGCLYCTLPSSWFHISPPRKPPQRVFTEKEKEDMRNRLKKARENIVKR